MDRNDSNYKEFFFQQSDKFKQASKQKRMVGCFLENNLLEIRFKVVTLTNLGGYSKHVFRLKL